MSKLDGELADRFDSLMETLKMNCNDECILAIRREEGRANGVELVSCSKKAALCASSS